MIRTSVGARPSLAARLGAFALERFPFACTVVTAALDAIGDNSPSTADTIDGLRPRLEAELRRRWASAPDGLGEPTPGVSSATRWSAAVDELVSACDGFLRRASIEASLTADERREILRGMALTRATDNRLKAFFTSGEVRYGDAPFQGKGFRSLGQEAIYAAAIRFRRGAGFSARRRLARRHDRPAHPRSRRGARHALRTRRWCAASFQRRWPKPARR